MKKFDEPPGREEPVQIVYLNEISNRIQRWKTSLPNVKPYYAIKSNPDNRIIETTLSHNIGYDCASKNEIKKILDLGVDPSRIIYANPYKQPDFIKFALDSNVIRMTFDSIYELNKIADIDKDRRSELVLRMKVDNGKSSIISFSEKFGAEKNDAEDILNHAKNLGLNVIGLSFHVGSMCYDPLVFEESLRICSDVFKVADRLGMSFNFLDIGGGFSGKTFESCAEVISSSLEKWFSEDVEIIAEPGRFICESSIDVYCRVIGKSFKGGKFHYIINDGVYGSFVSVMYDARIPEPEVLKKYHEDAFETIIWGNTCDSMDCILRDLYMQELEIGDWLVFREYGAYGQPCEGFNGFGLTEKLYVLHDK
jgi:ornithine decarboxylase